MTAAIPIIGEKCPYCSRFVSHFEVVRFGESMLRCWHCQQKHEQALDVLAGNPPKACGECGQTFEDLAARAGEEVSMYLHLKDGLYQLLCARCDRIYVEKNKQLFKDTRFGRERGLV